MKNLFFLAISIALYSNQVYAQDILHIAGSSTIGVSGDGGPATLAAFEDLNAICRDAAGNIYVGDNDRVRRIDKMTGIITTIAGSISSADTTDNIPATSAGIFEAAGLCIGGVDGAEYLYIADSHYKIRKVNLATGIITTAVGRGPGGYGGDGGQATSALLGEPRGVAIDPEGNLYIAEYFNNTIRKVTAATGIITTIGGAAVAGAGSYGGDGGPATAALLDGPEGVALDSHGNVYIADNTNNRIRRIDAVTGVITTVAGIGPTSGLGGSYSGDGAPATAAGINLPVRIAFDRFDNMYIADLQNFRIRRVDAATGIITTYAGNGMSPGSGDTVGDNGPATTAKIVAFDLCIDSCGNIFFNGATNVRAVTSSGPSLAVCGPPSLGVPTASIKEWNVYPNPATNQLTIDNPIADGARYELVDMAGRTALTGHLQAGTQQIDIHSVMPGRYIINLYTGTERSYTATILKE